ERAGPHLQLLDHLRRRAHACIENTRLFRACRITSASASSKVLPRKSAHGAGPFSSCTRCAIVARIMNAIPELSTPSREDLLSSLYEAAELEHNLMCTYLYAAFSLKSGEAEGLSAREAEAVARWRRAILDVAIDEMGHLTAVWNITAALGGAPRFG